MARNLGSWWIKDGIDGRRLEAQGFASTLGGLSQFDWTEDHGESDVRGATSPPPQVRPSAAIRWTRCRCPATARPTGSRLERQRDDQRRRRLRQARPRDLRDARLQPARAHLDKLSRPVDSGVPAAALHAGFPQQFVLGRRSELAGDMVRDLCRVGLLLDVRNVGTCRSARRGPRRTRWSKVRMCNGHTCARPATAPRPTTSGCARTNLTTRPPSGPSGPRAAPAERQSS